MYSTNNEMTSVAGFVYTKSGDKYLCDGENEDGKQCEAFIKISEDHKVSLFGAHKCEGPKSKEDIEEALATCKFCRFHFLLPLSYSKFLIKFPFLDIKLTNENYIVKGGFVYVYQSTARDCQLYDCSSTNCNAQIKMMKNHFKFLSSEHQCRPNKKKARDEIFKNIIKNYVDEFSVKGNEIAFEDCLQKSLGQFILTSDEIKKIQMPTSKFFFIKTIDDYNKKKMLASMPFQIEKLKLDPSSKAGPSTMVINFKKF